MQLRCFLQRSWCLLKNMVGRFPLQKWSGVSLQKWSGVSLQNWPNASFCKSGRALLKKLGWALLKSLGRPLLLQKAGSGRIFSLRLGRPPRNTWASKVRPRKLKFGRRYFRQGS
ncbi:hypothetical protein Pyn_14966 [Prunus yedoensis var. nudiflora]|uniref:Uncharacterized protein n=1 Tax=Prunus yedoensis var. nudiflora TaxID=2094558 RepID=A0A315AXS7_PRUYE|nr:hypothetical protein Pyn_14966 [Prunus yedoensis var. nudiflora]